MAVPGVSSTTPGASAHAASAKAGHPAPQPGAHNQAGGYPPSLPNGLASLPPRAGKKSFLARATGAIAKGVKDVFQTKDAVPVQKKETAYPDDPVKLRKILYKKFLASRDARAEHVEAAGLGRMRDPASKKFKWGSRDYWKHEIAIAGKCLEADALAENAKLSDETPEVIRLRKKSDKLAAAHNEYMEVLEKIKEQDPDFYYNATMANNAFTCGVHIINMERRDNSLDAGAADPLVNSMAAKMSAEVARIAAYRKNAGNIGDPVAVLHGERWHGHAMFAGILTALPEMAKSLSSPDSAHAMAYMQALMNEWHAVQSAKGGETAEKGAAYAKAHAALALLSAHASQAAAEHAAQTALKKSEEEELPQARPQQPQPPA